MDLKHEILCDLKDVAQGLGRAPKRDEYVALGKFSKQMVDKHFGNFTALIHASGMIGKDVHKQTSKKEPPSFNNTNGASILRPNRRLTPTTKIFESALCIPDLHIPWENPDTLSLTYAIAEERQPDLIGVGGDLGDMFSWGRYARSLNLITPDQELKLFREKSTKMFETLRRICPKATIYLLWGNHDERPLKQTRAKYPEIESLVSEKLRELYTFPGVITTECERDELFLNVCGEWVIFMHGFLEGNLQHAHRNQFSTVRFHNHKGWTNFIPVYDPITQTERTIWELSCGFHGNRFASPLSYTMQKKVSQWTLGRGWIDGDGPRFIPG